ncbi:thioredoxin-disulfide reductase [Alphaproteobacteria bacterium]|jgi:thioredoxin reductase (NADPH)|nr:thioredoxin-disulfide reductase [Alphaproteobacteria bacterium]MDA9817129.1 thioredoxin-disulfide reductase [Alphaproteobacteria bacterium]MDB2618041.1 thioredoxin-disulfide reductase [Alphaproteobacteria bacterium]MDC0968919.1 thioredoxin-disulfide reductase [Alphaproteobacteria bacterium]MDC6453193.1 thioredoxin-disulfide reductase [Alphaproteobacteria bacterium]
MIDSKEKVIIIGSGAAGLTAAIYAARANLKPLVIEGIQPGGQLTITTDVENYPGYADVVQGPWMMEQMRLQAEKVGARIISDIVTSVDFKKNNKIINLDSGKTLETQTVIITTGAQAKWLGLKSENDFNGKGVSACATCDGFFYKNKEVAVVGGGNTAVEEALYLSNICSKVTLIHRRNELRSEKILQKRLFDKDNIKIIWNNVVSEIKGNENGVNAIELSSTVSKRTEIINVDGIFIAIGHSPSTEAFTDVLDMDDEGYIIAQKPGTCLTNIDGVFAAGDCVDKVYRQAVTAAGMGCMAALDAEKWIQNQ